MSSNRAGPIPQASGWPSLPNRFAMKARSCRCAGWPSRRKSARRLCFWFPMPALISRVRVCALTEGMSCGGNARLRQFEVLIECGQLSHLVIGERLVWRPQKPLRHAEMLHGRAPEGMTPPFEERDIVAEHQLTSRVEVSALHRGPELAGNRRGKRRESFIVSMHAIRLVHEKP